MPQGVENSHGAIVLYDVEAGVAKQATSGFYDDSNSVFSGDSSKNSGFIRQIEWQSSSKNTQ